MTVNNTPINPPGLSEVGITNTPGLTGRYGLYKSGSSLKSRKTLQVLPFALVAYLS